jgi:hypothetical protein
MQMKFLKIINTLIAIFLLGSISAHAQNPENWTSKQLVEPADLAASIKTNKDLHVVISIGPGAVIPNSLNVGMVNNKEGIAKLKTQLKDVPKEAGIVLYCGCCPFDHCPNVRPAIDVLKQMNFTNYRLLNLPHNIKTDWIDKGFPTATP